MCAGNAPLRVIHMTLNAIVDFQEVWVKPRSGLYTGADYTQEITVYYYIKYYMFMTTLISGKFISATNICFFIGVAIQSTPYKQASVVNTKL